MCFHFVRPRHGKKKKTKKRKPTDGPLNTCSYMESKRTSVARSSKSAKKLSYATDLPWMHPSAQHSWAYKQSTREKNAAKMVKTFPPPVMPDPKLGPWYGAYPRLPFEQFPEMRAEEYSPEQDEDHAHKPPTGHREAFGGRTARPWSMPSYHYTFGPFSGDTADIQVLSPPPEFDTRFLDCPQVPVYPWKISHISLPIVDYNKNHCKPGMPWPRFDVAVVPASMSIEDLITKLTPKDSGYVLTARSVEDGRHLDLSTMDGTVKALRCQIIQLEIVEGLRTPGHKEKETRKDKSKEKLGCGPARYESSSRTDRFDFQHKRGRGHSMKWH